MTTAAREPSHLVDASGNVWRQQQRKGSGLPGWLMLAALLVVALPTLYGFANIFWVRSSDTQAPIVVAALAYAFWRESFVLDWETSTVERGCALIAAVLSLALYVLGRSQQFYQLEGVGLVGFIGSLVLMAGGWRGLKRVRFLLFLLLFVIPVPATAADAALVPLKKLLSEGVVYLFNLLGYPVANHGVVLSVGFYQLQIADACAGLRSLLALVVIGFLFIYFVPARSKAVNLWLLLLLPFLALLANFVRVCILVLITYYIGGDASEQAHNFVGYMEIGIALGMFMGAHSLLEWLLVRDKPAEPKHA